jgi:hypothetical protein
MRTWKLKNVVEANIRGHADDPETAYGAAYAKRRLACVWRNDVRTDCAVGIGIWVCVARLSPKVGDVLDLGKEKLKVKRVEVHGKGSMPNLYCKGTGRKADAAEVALMRVGLAEVGKKLAEARDLMVGLAAQMERMEQMEKARLV